jgi:nucleoside-diphosphate-sugar epimerase
MTVLVTGAGLVGAAFAREAIAAGERVIFIDPAPRADYLRFKLGAEGWSLVRADVRDLPALIAAMKDNKVETVLHSAGLIGSKVQDSLSAAFDINLGGTRNVAEAVRLTGVKRLVHVSTMGVYDSRRPVSANVPEDFPRGARRGYGNYKAAKELILEAYADHHKFELMMMRPANVYGFGHFAAGSSGGMKMQAMVEAAMDGKSVQVPQSQTLANEYIHWKDVGRALRAAAVAPMPKDYVFNVGNGYVTTFDELAATLQAINPAARFDITPDHPPKSKAHAMDITRAAAQLGWAPAYSMKEGIADYMEELKAARAFFTNGRAP